MSDEVLGTIILIALPASGKSEVRAYLDALDPATRETEMHIAPQVVAIDDFEYVWNMRSVDEALVKGGKPRIFFQSSEKPFNDPRDWGTLIHLVNEDWWSLRTHRTFDVNNSAKILLRRLDAARLRVGAPPALSALDPSLRLDVELGIYEQASRKLNQRNTRAEEGLDGKTLIIEFARGGPRGATFPLPAPLGYAHALQLLDPLILKTAVVLYVWVAPEESRRRNEERADPNNPGSTLRHSVPLDVMLGDYGCDDVEYLIGESDKPNTIRVEKNGGVFYLPTARFDNRSDKTSFVRRPRETWTDDEIAVLHEDLKSAFETLHTVQSAQ
ncbi:MAG: hypothetical protein Q7S16_05805 [bacterium]|nr:hypothetical protein [bacterium]